MGGEITFDCPPIATPTLPDAETEPTTSKKRLLSILRTQSVREPEASLVLDMMYAELEGPTPFGGASPRFARAIATKEPRVMYAMEIPVRGAA